ncbi:hypothetical protein [Mycolicibacterium peregrinum]|uniref:hypothetical protein n=1 Tax=Mycolicibacterium peregrinum TaxID=43304 RepID=UPI0010542C97|nr:hypothetical protein [Mycolicibacterium peregrinum]
MDINEMYGIGGGRTAPVEPDGAPSDPAESSAAEEPGTAGDPGDGASEMDAADANEQMPDTPVVAKPTRAAVREIHRLLATGQHPVDTATPFSAGASHALDVEPEGPSERSTKAGLRGLFGALFGSGRSVDHDQDVDDQPRELDEAGTKSGTRPAKDGAGDSDSGGDAKSGWSLPVAPRHLAVGAVFAVVVLIAAVMVGRGGQPEESLPSASAPSKAAVAAPGKAQHDAPITIRRDDVSAVCGPGSSHPFDAFGGKDRAWKCLAPYNGVGQVLTIKLSDGPYVITSIRVVPGYDAADRDGSDLWLKNRQVAKATWRFDGASPVPQVFDGTHAQQSVAVPNAVARVITMTINKTDAPTAAPTGKTSTAQVPGLSPQLPKWLDPSATPLSPTGDSPVQNGGGEEPTAFAVSSIEIVGHVP